MFARHDLIWLSESGWQAACEAAQPEHRAALEQWQRNDWPAVVRRRDANTFDNEICAGVPLPPDPDSGNKVRIALRVQALEVIRHMPPLTLKAVLPALPEAWQELVSALGNRAVGLLIRVYGSAALQALTGQRYLTETSDIDLLFYPISVQQLQAGLALLAFHATQLPLDGEIVFPSGQAVAWKEWLQAQQGDARVLVKEADVVHLCATNALMASFRP